MNTKFSDRMGITKPRDAIQIEGMDNALKNGLWNMLCKYYWDMGYEYSGHFIDLNHEKNVNLLKLCTNIYEEYFKERIDQMNVNFHVVKSDFDGRFFSFEWYEVYNFVEFVGKNGWTESLNANFQKQCNEILEREMSGYRFVGGIITPISNSQELESIEKALDISSNPVKVHLNTALTLLSDRQAPDYRNSIKESISAVEALASEIVGEKPILGKLLRKLEQQITLHPSLKKAFEQLYAFTSDEGGIRHALEDDSIPIDFHDAKFMMIACSAFINYVNGKLEV